MHADIFLVGAGQTPFGEHWDKGFRELMDEAIGAALAKASCTALDIDCVIVANMLGEITGSQAHLGALASSLLPHRPPALRVESACASGAMAIHTACAFLESGRVETVLVLGVEKMTDQNPDVIAMGLMGAADSERDAPTGITFPGIFGLIARRYMWEYGLTREDLSLVSSRHHRNAIGNSYAQFQQEISPEDVSQSAMVADPLRLLDCSPLSDGAAACILSTKRRSPIQIRASHVASDSVSLTERASITSFPATRESARRAFGEAHISPKDIDHLETHDCFSIAAIMNLEDLGFAEPGTGIELYRSTENSLKINAGGGLKACGHPVAATGVKQVAEVATRLESSGRFGLAHNFGGAGASSIIHILERTS